MGEFALIDEIVAQLGEQSRAAWVSTGPGDDATVVQVTPQHEVVASIDSFLEGVHFPPSAPPEDVGYRTFMASASDLAAMGAKPRYALVAMSLPDLDKDYVLGLCQGMAEAANLCGMAVCGGNLSKGPLNITVSVHGEVASGQGLLRSNARVGDLVQVSGPLGQAAACVRLQAYEDAGALREAYFRPRARVDLIHVIESATAAIDISDGCLQDLGHIAKSSDVGISVVSERVPVGEGAILEDALWGGDDYELIVTAEQQLRGFTIIGDVIEGAGVLLDGQEVGVKGYDHFRA